jgi:hypothetical protein
MAERMGRSLADAPARRSESRDRLPSAGRPSMPTPGELSLSRPDLDTPATDVTIDADPDR